MSDDRSNTISLSRCSLWAVLLLMVACDDGATPREIRETGPTDVSVVPEMLVGAEYRGRTGGDQYDDLTWVFDETHFRVLAGKAGLPPDLVKALLPADVTGFRIDGQWSVEGELLSLTELAVDGKPVNQPPSTLRAMCTPVIRIEADEHQYMFRRGTPTSAWRQGEIPQWPPGTTSVSGSVKFDRAEQGWLHVGYRGVVEDGESISDGASVRSEPDDSGTGFAQTTTHAPRTCRLELRGSEPARIQCLALPPGTYLFYAQWEPDRGAQEGKIVAEFERWRLQGQFAAKWIVTEERPLTDAEFNLLNANLGEIKVHAPAVEAYQSVFLLPWSDPDTEPPPLTANQAWEIARWAGNQIAIRNESGMFQSIPVGRYRLFLVEHDQPAKEEDTLLEYRVKHDKTVAVRKDATVEVSF